MMSADLPAAPPQSARPRGRGRAKYVVYGVAFAAVLLYSSLLPGGHMPGPLSPEHEYIGDRCESCHKPLTGDTESGCLTCHPPAELVGGWREHRRERENLTNESSARAGWMTRNLDDAGIWVLSLGAALSVIGAGTAWEAWKRRRASE